MACHEAKQPSCLIDGQPGTGLSAWDRGLHYGDGVFETIAVRDGEPRHWERHLQRLATGCERLGFEREPDPGLLRSEADTLCTSMELGVLKLIVTRGLGGRGYGPGASGQPTRVMLGSPWPERPAEYVQHGVELRHCDTVLSRNRRLAGIKHLNRLEQVLARAELGDRYPEGLMSDDLGNVIEGTMSNLFAVAGGAIITPDLSESGVCGIMRALVIDRAEQLGLEVRVTPVGRELLASADELFLTNSIIGIWPVRRLEDRNYGVGPVTRFLQRNLDD